MPKYFVRRSPETDNSIRGIIGSALHEIEIRPHARDAQTNKIPTCAAISQKSFQLKAR